MRKMGLVTGLLAALAVVLAAVGALCGAAVSLARDEKTYSVDSRAAVMEAMGLTSQEEVTAYIGIDETQQAELAAALAAQMAGEPERAVTAEQLSESERQHLRDVQKLVSLGDSVSKGCVSLAAALAVVVRRGQDGAGDSFGAAQIAQHPAQVGAGVAVGDQVIPALPLHVRQIFQLDTDFIAAEGIRQQILPLDVQAVALFILPEELNGRGGEFHRGHFLSEMDSWPP